MSINSSRLNDYNSKSYNIMNYIDYDRYKNRTKINIDYTFHTDNSVITEGPRFNSNKIIKSKTATAYTNGQKSYISDSFKRIRVVKEYNKIR